MTTAKQSCCAFHGYTPECNQGRDCPYRERDTEPQGDWLHHEAEDLFIAACAIGVCALLGLIIVAPLVLQWRM